MSQTDVQDYLEKGMYGTPQLKPEEKRQYLGTFRERIFLTMTIAEMTDKKNITHFRQELADNPQQQVLINAAVDFAIQNDYMVAAQKANCPFKIVDTENQNSPEAIGLVYASETAVNIETVAVTQKYQTTPQQTKEDPFESKPVEGKKKSWFSRLFN